MPENPSYNSSHPKWRGTELADLDCGNNIKVIEASGPFQVGSYEATANKVLAVGECVSLIRVKAGTEILGAELYWGPRVDGTCASNTVLAVGDPFCCARLLGPINTLYSRGTNLPGGTGCAQVFSWGACGTLVKFNTLIGDGCGIGYTYTCQTDIVLTNLYHDGFATVGGGAANLANPTGSKAGAALTSGHFRLVLHVRQK